MDIIGWAILAVLGALWFLGQIKPDKDDVIDGDIKTHRAAQFWAIITIGTLVLIYALFS